MSILFNGIKTWAKEVGRDDCASMLQQSLDEEKATDAKFTCLREARLNRQADMQTA